MHWRGKNNKKPQNAHTQKKPRKQTLNKKTYLNPRLHSLKDEHEYASLYKHFLSQTVIPVCQYLNV